jgi:hypothetical protein
MHATDDQLSLDVGLHSAIDARDALLTGALTIGGNLVCGIDLNAGDEITVTVATADGTVIAQGLATCGYPVFREIVDRGEIIGTERCNKAKVA